MNIHIETCLSHHAELQLWLLLLILNFSERTLHIKFHMKIWNGFLVTEEHTKKWNENTQDTSQTGKNPTHLLLRDHRSNTKKFCAKHHEKFLSYSWHRETTRNGYRNIQKWSKGEGNMLHFFSFFDWQSNTKMSMQNAIKKHSTVLMKNTRKEPQNTLEWQ